MSTCLFKQIDAPSQLFLLYYTPTKSNLFLNSTNTTLAEGYWLNTPVSTTSSPFFPKPKKNINYNLISFFHSILTPNQFFYKNKIDVPSFVKNYSHSTSFYFPTSQRIFLKNLTLNGCYEKNLKVWANTLLLFSLHIKTKTESHINNFWRYFQLFCSYKTPKPYLNPVTHLFRLTNKFNSPLNFKLKSTLMNVWGTAVEKFFIIQPPMFTFYVQKVDKNLLKYSRGKLNKYSLTWKYLPIYKRLTIVTHWVKRDVKLQKSPVYSHRILKFLETLCFLPHLNLTLKLRFFVHKFVFTKFKKNLLKPLNIKH